MADNFKKKTQKTSNCTPCFKACKGWSDQQSSLGGARQLEAHSVHARVEGEVPLELALQCLGSTETNIKLHIQMHAVIKMNLSKSRCLNVASLGNFACAVYPPKPVPQRLGSS